jgi:hypothetical protein
MQRTLEGLDELFATTRDRKMPFDDSITRLYVSLTLGSMASLCACNSGGVAPGDDAPGTGQPTTEAARQMHAAAQQSAAQLGAAYPQASVHFRRNRMRRLYGVAATGNTPDEAAESFRRSSAAAFGVDDGDLAPVIPGELAARGSAAEVNAGTRHADASPTRSFGLMYDHSTGTYKFRLYAYQQTHAGVPVFHAGLRTLVREDGNHAVVWANIDLRPVASFMPQSGLQRRSFDAAALSVDLEKSLQALRTGKAPSVQSLPAPSALTLVGTPKQTIFAGTDEQTAAPQLALEYTAIAADGRGKWTFVADTATGDILHVESNLHFDVSGTVTAEVTTGPEAIECGVRGVAPLAYANISSAFGSAVTDATGTFTIPGAQGESVTIVSDVTGRYFTVNDEGSSDSLTVSVTPPSRADFLHQDTQVPPERILAQLNAYTAANDIRDLLLAHVPDYPVISGQTEFRMNVNRTGLLCDPTGGAWYDDDSVPHTLNFCQQTEGRTNTAFRSIVHHEYGHHLVESAGSGQAEYGEGMADVTSVLFSKDPRIGVGYYRNQCQRALRNVVNDCQYSEEFCSSCGSTVYDCGSLLSGTVWDLWQRLEATEPEQANDIIRELVFSSVPLHTGTSIDESIAIDLLTLDDDDALLENGTPHYAEICGAFAKHGMTCPAIASGLIVKGTDLVAEGASDGPFAPASVSYTLHNLGPRQNLPYSVRLPSEVTWLSVSGERGSLGLGQTATVTATINQAEAALLPDGNYTATIQFVDENTGAGSASRDVKLRVGAPLAIYTADFDSGSDGFTVDNDPANLWHQSTVCVDALPGHTSPGSLYYGRDETCEYTASAPNFHTITSPAIELVNPSTAELGFKYFLETENSSDFDRASVLISVNDGTFQTVASNNSTGQKLKETTDWQELRFDITEFLPATATTRIRLQFAFNGVTIDANRTQGFAIDDVTVYAKK